MNNPVMPKPHQILDIIRETNLEYTFRIETDMRPKHGQFFQLSLPRVGECPISVSNFGEGWIVIKSSSAQDTIPIPRNRNV